MTHAILHGNNKMYYISDRVHASTDFLAPPILHYSTCTGIYCNMLALVQEENLLKKTSNFGRT